MFFLSEKNRKKW